MTFAAEVAAEELEDERAAVDDLLPLWENNQAKKAFEKEMRKLDPSASDYGAMGRVRRWLMDHEEELVDQEHGITAKLQSGGRTKTYDSPGIRERAPHLWSRLQEIGALRIDEGALANAMKAGLISEGDLSGFVIEGERSKRLIIERK